MLNGIIKLSFSLVGAVTGYTLTRTLFMMKSIPSNSNITTMVNAIVSLLFAFLFYFTAAQIITYVHKAMDKVEHVLQNMTLYELALGSAGLIAGLVVANLITIPVNDVYIIGLPLSIIANVLFGCLGISIAVGKSGELSAGKGLARMGKSSHNPKILDTSVIIDGRIVDICRSGFIEGELIVPSFVLEELRHIADSADAIKRNRGRRGLDVLNMLQKDLQYPVKIENYHDIDGNEADDKLLKLAKKLNCKIITNDYNLNKVASFQDVSVLNINELANAVKPIAIPGEEMVVQVIKDGKENGQGIGYLDDGTMIVVEGGRKHIGESVNVVVTSIIQTAAGRMIFAKPKCMIEKAI